MNKIRDRLTFLNPEFVDLIDLIEEQVSKINQNNPDNRKGTDLFSEHQSMLITYADQFQKSDERPLETLNSFLSNELQNALSLVHLLPFYPWTSDDGFSPINFHQVKEEYGTWDDIKNISQIKMFDCVFNHVSSENEFFKKALMGEEKYQRMFHFVSEKEYLTEQFQENIKKVVRPRTSPLFTPFNVNGEKKYVWTTFSSDQIDTNLNNKDMLQYILESFFLYIENGARFFRVDAVPFMWKELGTNCSHLPKTHGFVKLLRSICDEINIPLYIVTESNVPHHENITYFGDSDEAHIVYNFSLSPLIIHAITFGTTKVIKEWASNVFDTPENTCFLNFTATHDGIGMRGLEGLVNDEDIRALCDHAERKGGHIGLKQSRDGSVRPYELNITWPSMMKEDDLDPETYARKVAHTQALVMFFPGIGAHYAHNFLGTENWTEGYEESGIARRLNRKKTAYPPSCSELQKKIRATLVEFVKLRSSSPAFHPKAEMTLLPSEDGILAFEREFQGHKRIVLFNFLGIEGQFRDKLLRPFELVILN